MKKEELLSIGLTEEQADKVFSMNGKDVEKYKKAAEDAKADKAAVEKQLADRDKDIESLKALDADGLKKQLSDLQSKYTTETEQYKAQLADRDYSDAITRAISGKALKFSSKSAERAFIAALKEKKLELKDGELAGLDDFIKAQKEADPDAFAPDKPAPKFTSGNSGGGHGEPPEAIPANVAQAKEMGAARAASLKASNEVLKNYL